MSSHTALRRKCNAPGCENVFEPRDQSDTLCQIHKLAHFYVTEDGLNPEEAYAQSVAYWEEKIQREKMNN